MNVPKHIVLFPDGNRRWAKQKGLKSLDGHKKGYENLLGLSEWCKSKGIKTLTDLNLRTNLHIIVGEPGSADRFWKILEEFDDKIEYFVILPYQAVGRAAIIEVESEWIKLFDSLLNRDLKNVAFGALFYPFILKNKDVNKLDVFLYKYIF